jgi:flavin reductase (DIM6/NTAB) family NADH-FMN oxidoreductase RutF
MNKIKTEYLKYFWPMRHYLITCSSLQRHNIIAVSFCMPISNKPPMVACAIGQHMYSAELLLQAGEFVVNVPAPEMRRQIYYCGFHSGREVDKFKETGFTPMPARKVNVPIIAECLAHIECRVEQHILTGDKYVFIARVVEAYANEDVEQGLRELEISSGDFPQKVYGGRFTGN